jgi:hypothetical protein
MRAAHGNNAKVPNLVMADWTYDGSAMNDYKGSVTRTLTIVLPEPEWRALRQAEPDAIGWLHERIRERLSSPVPDRQASTPAGWSGRDEY